MKLEALVATLGLPGIVIGAALEGEAVTFFGGIMAHRGLFPVEAAAFAAALGALIVDQAMFMLGRHGARTRLVRHVLERPPVARLRGWLERHPTGFVLSFRFIYGIKTASALLIGTTSIPWMRFAALNVVAVLVWAHVVTWIGYSAGMTIERIFGHMPLHIHLSVGLVLAVVLALVLSLALHRWMRRA